ncbi:aldo/keto reductase [Nocardioides marmotae]|uniref:aldo/keto reductase n=1 Tax=Nocardioides marmotae TaxID=2663857 RepID=UPI0012B50588|nr:aldo/keto reductase [Nocardioides marmotae]MBC9732810.1 aldo/keto reductase [Nocardioides marmotae]MTB83924.1 aldo/keto reductase [Nocardioides marmotae]
MNDLDHRRLGGTGLPVSRLCLGTATFGGQCDEETARAVLDRAADLGFTFLDTADKYPIGSGPAEAGVTESIIGRWLRGQRDSYVIATKVHGPTGPRPWDAGLSRRHVIAAAEASLRRLQTDYIDLYQLHRPDPGTPIDETLSALDALVQAGKVRYVGVSNHLAYQVARLLGRAELRGYEPLASTQSRYNLLFRQHERELLPLCGEEGLGVLAYNVLAGGLLSGKHDLDAGPLPGTRFDNTGAATSLYRDRYWHDEAFVAVRALTEVAGDLGISLPVLATAWVLANPQVTSALIGVTRPDQLDVAARAVEVTLPPQALDRLDALTSAFRQGDATQ